MGITAAAMAFTARGIGLGYNIASLVHRQRRRNQGECNEYSCNSEDELTHLAQIWGFQSVASVAAAAALPLLGTGFAKAGQSDAYRFIFRGEPARRRSRAVLGWSMFAGGLAVYALTRVPFNTDDMSYYALQRDIGFFAGLAVAVPGVAMAGYASGYSRAARKFEQTRLSLSRTFTQTMSGISISGRF